VPRNDDARGVDALIRSTERVEYVKTSAYLRPDQMELLDGRRAGHRAAGRRTVSASDLVRTALDLAAKHQEEWDALVAQAAGQ
jgi:hypothetical protein